MASITASFASPRDFPTGELKANMSANAEVILLVSSHLESGHYFNPHAQRIIDGTRANGAKLIVFDTRLSNTATHADRWLSPYPGSEPAVLLAVADGTCFDAIQVVARGNLANYASEVLHLTAAMGTSEYWAAALESCRAEVHQAEAMMRREGIQWLSSTHKSIEEIATTILRDLRPDRLVY